ncbi:DUF4214 domain-containing protein [Octadecabacter sp. CECT 8868]|uniref:DUF4214 domain-containing protein n=1 Tax=Octadecabacter algicola TaxID=2909342 RepID=UPI001F257CBC|nr:DUF4214 domain-containing protein [Octadecabacter algicola]MCF2903382.1 DUF4214 domain-containing protein [Octadecabacter algicola]
MDDFFFPEHYAPDSLEEVRNDTIQTAQLIAEGTYDVSGLGHDWYEIRAQAGFLNITMTPGDEPLNLEMALHNSDGVRIQRAPSPSGEEILERRISTEDTYFLRVFAAPLGDNPAADTELDYTLSIDLPEYIEDDGNDTLATATTLDEGTSGPILGTGIDWWKVTSPSGSINVTMTAAENLDDPDDFRDDLRNLNMELYDSDGNLLRSNFSTSMVEDLTYLAPTAGDYFIKVYTSQFGGNTPAPDNILLSYSLDIDLPEEENRVDTNGSIATAELLSAGETVVTDGIGSDWYQFESGPGLMEFSMTNTDVFTPDGTAMNLNMRLYDADGTPIRNGFQEFADESFEQYSKETATYFLNVYWAPYEGQDLPNGVVLDYTLNVDLPVNTWSKELEFGPIRNASASVYDIDNDGKDEIFVGAVKSLDDDGNEILPGGLIVLEDNGDVKWSQTFPAISGADPVTGLFYNSTSVTTAPVFSDVNGDGSIDIIVGVGADNRNEFAPAGQPGDMGGVYALDSDGNILWSHINEDSFGLLSDPNDPESASGPDGRPDGTYGTPRVFDIDADGQREVIVASWDHYLYVLNGSDGSVEYRVDLHDTAGASPAVADLDLDGLFEIIAPADITANARAGIPEQGGILHVLNNYGHQTVSGWDTQVGTSTNSEFRGQFDEQSLWSSPTTADLNNDGSLEIIQGTGNYFQDDRGQHVNVWDAEGNLVIELATQGRVLAGTLVADLDGVGGSEIIAATLDGYVHAWSASGQELFSTQVMPYNPATGEGVVDIPIARQPVAVDLTGDGNLEILVSIGSQVVVLDSQGNQITNTESAERAFNNYAGSPVAHDIDDDGYLDLITGGTNAAQDHAVVYRWENIVDTQFSTETRIGEYQNSQSLNEIEDFVQQLYVNILGREADARGQNNWTDRLYTGVLSGSDVARGLIFSQEFVNQNTTNDEFVSVLYKAIFGQDVPDERGFARWTGDLDDGLSRLQVLQGFTGSPQFSNLASSYGIRAAAKFGAVTAGETLIGDDTESSVLRAGAGDNTLVVGSGAVDDFSTSTVELAGQVYRLYEGTLGRQPDSTGFQGWFNGLYKMVEGVGGGVTLQQAANTFVNSAEFQKNYGELSDAEFVTQLYQNVLDRAPDDRGLARWTGDLADGLSRAEVVLGFTQATEFRANTDPELDDWMQDAKVEWNDVLEGGAGDDLMNAGTGSDVFVFRNGEGGSDIIYDFEPWDRLQLSGFGFDTKEDAISNMSQSGSSVVFEKSGQKITFLNTSLSMMDRVGYNLS